MCISYPPSLLDKPFSVIYTAFCLSVVFLCVSYAPSTDFILSSLPSSLQPHTPASSSLGAVFLSLQEAKGLALPGFLQLVTSWVAACAGVPPVAQGSMPRKAARSSYHKFRDAQSCQ